MLDMVGLLGQKTMSVLVRHMSPVPAAQFQGLPVPHSHSDSTSERPVTAVAAVLAALIALYVASWSRPSASPPHQSTLTKSKPQFWKASRSCWLWPSIPVFGAAGTVSGVG